MTIHAIATGTLFKPPEQRIFKTDKPFVTGTIRTKDGDSFQFMRFVAFSESAQAELLRLDDGDSLSIQGSLKAEIYEKDGEPRISLNIVASQVLALRQPPKERKPKASEPPEQRSRQERCTGSWAPGGGPNDEIPFGEPR